MKSWKCAKCQGTGTYEYLSKKDGKPQQGMCYQCRGKGRMTTADDNRTARYWIHRAMERD